jgi:glucose-6-phosphate 1-epimerase
MVNVNKGSVVALTYLDILHPSGSAVRIFHQGAHITSFKNAAGREFLFLSGNSLFESGKAIRGGIPVIFPQFADEGPLPKHGFARTALWKEHKAPEMHGEWIHFSMVLLDSAATRKVWDHAFEAIVHVRFSAMEMQVGLEIKNNGTTPFSFTAALHTYFAVTEVTKASLAGLKDTRYHERGDAFAKTEKQEAIRFTGVTDRIYYEPENEVFMLHQPKNHAVQIQHINFPDVVVWNPWEEGAAGLADMEPVGWRNMLCVEAARIADPVVLQPGETFEGWQVIS